MTATALSIVTLMAALAAAPGPPDAAIRVEHDQEAFTTKVHVRAPGGQVSWADMLRGLARARGYDDQALASILPEASFGLDTVTWRLARTAINLRLSPDVRLDVRRPQAEGEDPWLVISLDEVALLESQRKFKNRIRAAFLGKPRRPPVRYGLTLDEDWEKAPPERPLVISVHGLNSAPEAMEPLLAGPRRAGFPCGAMRFANDQAIAESGRQLAAELGRLARHAPQRRVALLTHSMGGLVARMVLEDPALDPGNVGRLMMIAPPNHGSMLAHFAYGLDISEHVGDRQRRKQTGLFYALVEDGLSEAYTDLKPGSQFLTRLNARKRNPNVRYAIFLGTSTPVRREDLAQLQQSLADPENRWVRFFGAKVRPWIDDMEEVVDGQGDGAVAVKRGRLEGVDDTHELEFNHINVLREPRPGSHVAKLHQMILERLKGRK